MVHYKTCIQVIRDAIYSCSVIGSKIAIAECESKLSPLIAYGIEICLGLKQEPHIIIKLCVSPAFRLKFSDLSTATLYNQLECSLLAVLVHFLNMALFELNFVI
ncbi:hypothetical protein AVEN_119088-1 [Araneus ventricosus]|uniref:Uncharacterized protein n=1 Tax=Araneus ventricosus TaxID=182803 RepID=A0A4Y2BKE4_ARAVE|nr:hypothetical protein AVEN_119088-1 [Araneus ventricosus]